MMMIDFFIDSLGPGGAERVASLLSTRWVSNGHDVRLVTLSDPADDFYPLSPDVRRASIGLLGPARNAAHGAVLNARRVLRIRHLLRGRRPDVVVSFTTRMNVSVLAASTATSGARVIVSERSNPRKHHVPRLVAEGRRRLYPRADIVVAQTFGAAEILLAEASGSQVEVIPNPVSDVTPTRVRQKGLVVAAGRLEHTKGFDLLIRAFDHVHRAEPDARLRIFGEGPMRAELTTLIGSLGMQDVVQLAGEFSQVQAAIGAGEVFVLSSRYEGFPNVLLEAMALGVPIVASRCDFGPEEIIDHGRTGLLVNTGDVRAIADAIRTLLGDENLRKALRTNGLEAVQVFKLDQVGNIWDHALGMRTAP